MFTEIVKNPMEFEILPAFASISQKPLRSDIYISIRAVENNKPLGAVAANQ